MTSIQVVTVGRKRRWTASEKKAMVDETYLPGMSVSYIARKHNLTPSLLFKWRRTMEEGALISIGAEESVVPASKAKQLEQRIKELERMLGKKTMENEILREAVKLAREKKLISRQPLLGLDDIL